nr:retrotransposon protein, putative, Ty1-copia subclass [Tanacetum cinerariifolium]
YGNFLERDLISQKFSGRDYDLEDDHMDTLPSENTSKILVESESLGSPPELILVCRSERTTRAPNRLCLNIEVEDDEVGDLGEPAKYKAAMLDPDKIIWQGAMDEEMNSMKVIKVWILVDLPPNAKVVRSKWLYKKKTDMDEVELQLGKKIKVVRSDSGGEYSSQEFKDYLMIVARYGNFLERDLISQKFSGRDYDLEDDHMDTLPSENTSKILVESESLGSPPEFSV